MTRCAIILCALLCASSASANHAQHVAVFGDRAWIADELKEGYQIKANDAGYEYELVPVAIREHEIRTELAMVGCLVSNHMASERRGPARRRTIIEHCMDQKVDWLQSLNRALRDTGQFEHIYYGQSVLAIIPIKTLHRVLRATIKHGTKDNEKDIFRKLVVPLLLEACALGSCGP
jgi:hypothetical protein